MSTVIRFPEARRGSSSPVLNAAPASIVILPVVRIERHTDLTEDPRPPSASIRGTRRRAPARRS
jgi:hypothetical protein